MTAQMPDEFIIEGESFSLVGLKGNGLYSPGDFGITPFSTCTACWRGYVMKYKFTKDQLILDEMLVNAKNPPEINGIEPQQGDNLFKYYYKNLNLKTKFTGSVLLAKDFIQSMYVHMGFQRPIAFKTVVEIHIENGTIIDLKDLTRKIAEQRKIDQYKGARPQTDSEKDIKRWIEKTFS
ncbi:MAG: hypothetical protein ACFE8B_13215, partial [Candidatus Hermodarchaeota archaeon]